MKFIQSISVLLVFFALVVCGGCRTWVPREAEVDSAWADEMDHLRQTTAARPDKTSPKNTPQPTKPRTALEARNMRLSPPVELGVNEFRPSLRSEKKTSGSTPAVAKEEGETNDIIVLSAQTPKRGQRLRPNPKLLRPADSPSRTEGIRVTPVVSGRQQVTDLPPVHLTPNQKVVEEPPQIPVLPILKPQLVENRNSTSPNSGETWDSVAAEEYEQPGTEWMQKNWQPMNRPFLANSRASTSDLDPLSQSNNEIFAAGEQPVHRIPKIRQKIAGADPAVRQVAHFEDTQETSDDLASNESENRQQEERNGTSEKSSKDSEVVTSGVPGKAPVTTAAPLDIQKTIRDLIGELENQLAAENFQNLPSREQERIQLSHQLLALLRQSSDGSANKDGTLDNDGRTKLLHEVLPLITRRYAENSDYEAMIGKLKKDLASFHPRPDGLRLGAVHFCTEISGFGKITKLSIEHFGPRQKALVYCEVEGFQSVEMDDGAHATYLRGAYEITDEVGVVVQSRQFPQIVDKASSKRRDFYIHLPVKLDSLQPGNYQLQVIVADQTSHESARLAVPLKFKVAAAVRDLSRQK